MGKPLLLLTAGNGEHVNVQRRASAAADRHGGRDWIREVEATARGPRILTLPDILQGVFNLTFKDKNGDEFKLPTPVWVALIALAGVFLSGVVAFCAGGAYLIRSSTDSNTKVDMALRDLARIEQKIEKQDSDAQVRAQTSDAYSAALSNKVQFMTGLMSRDQQRQISQWERANPLPKPPDSKRRAKPSEQPTQDNEEGSQANYVRSSLQNHFMLRQGFGRSPGLHDPQPGRISRTGSGS